MSLRRSRRINPLRQQVLWEHGLGLVKMLEHGGGRTIGIARLHASKDPRVHGDAVIRRAFARMGFQHAAHNGLNQRLKHEGEERVTTRLCQFDVE